MTVGVTGNLNRDRSNLPSPLAANLKIEFPSGFREPRAVAVAGRRANLNGDLPRPSASDCHCLAVPGSSPSHCQCSLSERDFRVNEAAARRPQATPAAAQADSACPGRGARPPLSVSLAVAPLLTACHWHVSGGHRDGASAGAVRVTGTLPA